MTDVRYSPPKAHVSDVPAGNGAYSRPSQVVWAIKLAALNYVVGLVVLAATWEHELSSRSIANVVVSQVVGLLVGVWFYYKIYVGRNWARILLLVGAVLAPFTFLLAPVRAAILQGPILYQAQITFSTIVSVLMIWLLFTDPGRYWFERRKRHLAPLPDKLL